MANKRVHYAVKAVGVAPLGGTTYTPIHGLQSVGIDTNFNLERILEIGQSADYENKEEVPEITVNMNKVLDGYPPVYLLATQGSAAATLIGRSNAQCQVALSIFEDDDESATGTPQTSVHMSGMFVNSLNYSFPVQGNCTEEVSMVGNSKVWKTSSFQFSGTIFSTNADQPLAITGSGGVQRRQHVIFGGATDTILPPDVAGISSSGTNNAVSSTENASAVQNIRIRADLGRQELRELGRKGPYHRYMNIPVDVTTEIEIISKTGDMVNAITESDNLVNRSIRVKLLDGSVFDLGSRNKLTSVTMGGGDTGGGNDTCTYTFRNSNTLTVQHPQDPTTALRP